MKTKFYPLKDYPNEEEMKRFGLRYMSPYLNTIKAKFTGEKRCPKKGEWFLSGAIVEAYKAKNDLTTVYHIAVLVKIKTIEVEVI